ncbi:hypothetical protein FB45DRAFT_907456, partial [Roridomyces roridus]
MRRIRTAQATSDVLAATRVTLKAIRASTDAFPPLKSAVSAVLVILQLSETCKSNKKGCKHIAWRAARLVQDIWSQTTDVHTVLPGEVTQSILEIQTLLKEIKAFLKGLQGENLWQRLARQDRNKAQIDEYERLLDEAMMHFSVQINLELSLHRLHTKSAAVGTDEHKTILAASQM